MEGAGLEGREEKGVFQGAALAGEGNGPKNPKRQLVIELDRNANARNLRGGYTVAGITFTELRTPSLSQTGKWQINMDPQIKFKLKKFNFTETHYLFPSFLLFH